MSTLKHSNVMFEIIQVNFLEPYYQERWYVAIYNEVYNDFVIDFSMSFASREAAANGVNTVIQNHLNQNPMGK